MRLLLDECVPKRLRRELPGHEVRTVQHQQNLTGFGIGVVIMTGPSNDIDDLRPLVPAVLEALDTLQPGEIKRVGGAALSSSPAAGEDA